MSMSQPQDVEQIERNRKQAKIQRAKYTVGVIAPNGVIIEVHCPPPEKGKEEGNKTGDTIVRWINGGPMVTKRWKEKGYVLYSELAASDGESDRHDMWKRAIEARMQGLPIRGDVSSLYSKSVLERRAHAKAGSAHGGKAFNIATGAIEDDPEADKAKILSRLAEVGVPVPPDAKPDEPAKPSTSRRSARSSAGKAE